MGLSSVPRPNCPDQVDRMLLQAVEDGLPLVPEPYIEIGRRIGLTEAEVLTRFDRLRSLGIIKRFGVIVRHHELGYRANGMVVWNVQDHQVRDIGHMLSRYPFVTLCYQRPRRLPTWPYNLFTMIHGRNRDQVLAHIDELRSLASLDQVPHAILFSRRRFKQRGARYGSQQSDADNARGVFRT